ncbi:MAG: DNA-3-methyladenine glycosylase I [Cyclobacteriaceae bacterium]
MNNLKSETIDGLLVEIDQIGLRWEIILENQDKFKTAFCELDINKILTFKDTDHERLFMITALLATV